MCCTGKMKFTEDRLLHCLVESICLQFVTVSNPWFGCLTGAHIKASLPWDSSISQYFCFEYWFENPTPQDITTAHLMPVVKFGKSFH